MISVIIAFRFNEMAFIDQSRKNTIEKIFSYWQLMHELFDIELVFINDHSDNFWIEGSYIYPMPGIKKDWNQPAARNYGVALATGDQLLFTDIDHILKGNFSLLENSLTGNNYIHFPRMKKTDGLYARCKFHKNTFFIKKEGFPGYDEEFCGHYGHDDTEFFYRLNKTHKAVMSESTLTTYVIELISAGLPRDNTYNKSLLYQKTGIVI